MDEVAVTPFIPSENDVLSAEHSSEEDPPLLAQPSPVLSPIPDCDSGTFMMGNLNSPSYTLTDANTIRRDEHFYLCDGSCILRVGNILFNVHRSILSRDSSSFATLFTLPQGDSPEEGTSDERPIVLQGDTPEEFRNFLWALYALPHEIMIAQSSGADLNHLMDIARMANKYSFKSTESWALDAIQHYVERKPSPLFQSHGILFLSHPSTPTLHASKLQISQLVRLAQMCSHEELLATMVSLLRQFMNVSLHYSHLAMSLADELDLPELRGLAYLEVLQKSAFTSRGDGDNPALVEGDIQETSDGRIHIIVTPVQQHRLLSGHYRLSKMWERLRAVPLPFTHSPTCAAQWHQQTCMQSWTDFWKEKTKADPVLCLDAANVHGKLAFILKEFDKWGSATYMHQECRPLAKRAVQEKVKSIGDSLSNYFCEGGEF